MKVKDTFYFNNGRIVFIGSLDTNAKTIPPCDCEILVGNEVKARLRIDGEEIPKGKQSLDRAIGTSQQIDLGSLGIERGGFTIRSTK